MGVMYFAFRTCRIWNKGSQEKKTPNNRGAASKNYMGKTKITIAPQLYINLVWILPCKIVLLQNHSPLYYSEFSIHHVWPQAVGFVRHKAKFSWTLSDDQLLHLHLWDMHYKSTWRLIYHGIWYFTRFKISTKLNQQIITQDLWQFANTYTKNQNHFLKSRHHGCF